MLQAARPVDDWLADDNTPLALKQRLLLAQEMRRFAVSQLHLPDNASYHRYAQLLRRKQLHPVGSVLRPRHLQRDRLCGVRQRLAGAG